MPKPHRHVPVALALILGFLTSSCLYTKRVILRHGKKVTAATAPKLLTATRDELNARIAALYDIHSFQMTADLTPSLGSVYTGEITEFKDVTAFILFRKPAEIRIIGKYPVVGSTAFDMVSDGADFKLWLPHYNLFEIGANSAPRTSKNKFENLRPDDFLSSILIRPLDPATETDASIDLVDEEQALYVLFFLRNGQPVRSVWFDRTDNLNVVRQIDWNEAGEQVSDTRYSTWTLYDGVKFPAHIDINRPKDGYGVALQVQAMKMNPDLDDKFVLTQPEGSQLRELGAGK